MAAHVWDTQGRIDLRLTLHHGNLKVHAITANAGGFSGGKTRQLRLTLGDFQGESLGNYG